MYVQRWRSKFNNLFNYFKGTEVDLKKTIEYFKRASDIGCIESTYNLGCLYRDGNVNFFIKF